MSRDAVTIYHNPRCTKSRQALQLLRDHGIEPQIIEYLKTPPTAAELAGLLKRLKLTPQQIVRRGEAAFREQKLADRELSDQAWLQLLAEQPSLIERPIVVRGPRAVIGRPPENVLTLLTEKD
jgi:arsenate reductase